MYAQSLQRKSGQKFPNYVCSTYHKGHGCGYCSVPQQSILNIIAKVIRDTVLQGSQDRLEAAIARQIEQRAGSHNGAEGRAVKARLATIDKKIENATERLVSVDAELVPAIEKKLLELQAERRAICAQVASEKPKAKLDPKAVAAKIWQLDAIIGGISPARARAALRQIVERVDLEFQPGKATKRGRRFDFVRGTVRFASQCVEHPATVH
jgi:chorismate mutase